MSDYADSPRRPDRKVRVPQSAGLVRFVFHPVGKFLLGMAALGIVVGLSVFTYFYIQYAKLIDSRLKAGAYNTTAKIYASPVQIAVGDQTTASEIAAGLRHGGYTESRSNPVGYYTLRPDSIEIYPGSDSYFDQESAVVRISGGKIARIVSLNDNTERPMYELEPQLITNMYDRSRSKQRVVHFEDIPLIMQQALLAAEDKRFFQHSGFDPIGIIRSAYIDIKTGKNTQGASTLSMQLSKNMFLTPDRNWRRKVAEIMITLQLEQKLTKQQIFEMYCNQMDLGYRGSFTIRGFGEAAQTYFGKDIKSITLPEAATLAAMVKSASYYNPYRHADRLRERRNWVLGQMHSNKYITDRDYALAVDAPLKVSNGQSESSDAPYFVDMVNDELQNKFPGYDFQAQSDKIYTTLDIDLQRAANEAVAIGMKQADELIHKQKRFKNAPFVEPQCALIALDPHTGEVKALVGGRNYGASQLNRVLAERQPGSIFKAFVYAAAMNTALGNGTRTLTPATVVVDEATTFMYDGKPYEPNNFEHKFYGPVTLRRALAKSLNVTTVKVAEMVGYQNVVNLAHKAGISEDVKATPAMALGSYDATPIEMAGAYTVFANKGVKAKPMFVSLVKEPGGKVLLDQKPETKSVLDPRVNYLMVSMLEEVMRSGTAAGVRGRGFTVPAAGKTGTSHDGWFAGFTSDLLCVVWVGFDDNRELDLEGAHSALPVWTEFMKRALKIRKYSNAKPFNAPDGVVTVMVDPESGMPATNSCPDPRPEVFISGTEPVGTCPLHGGSGGADTTLVSGWDTQDRAADTPGEQPRKARRSTPPAGPVPPPYGQTSQNQQAQSTPEKPEDQPKKKGVLGKVLGIFK